MKQIVLSKAKNRNKITSVKNKDAGQISELFKITSAENHVKKLFSRRCYVRLTRVQFDSKKPRNTYIYFSEQTFARCCNRTRKILY